MLRDSRGGARASVGNASISRALCQEFLDLTLFLGCKMMNCKWEFLSLLQHPCSAATVVTDAWFPIYSTAAIIFQRGSSHRSLTKEEFCQTVLGSRVLSNCLEHHKGQVQFSLSNPQHSSVSFNLASPLGYHMH